MDLTPKPSMLHALVNADLAERHVTAICEFVDNSLGEGEGDAQHVEIYWDKDRICVTDDGNGVRKLELLFRVGDSHSRLNDKNIGRYGLGAKIGGLYLGWHIKVETVFKGEPKACEVDWQAVAESDSWIEPNATRDTRRRSSGTKITISKRHAGRVWQGEPLAKRLAHLYRPGLLLGRSITLIQRTGSKQKEYDLHRYMCRLHIEDKTRIHGAVNGKSFVMTAGRVRNPESGIAGVHVAFGHRFITTYTGLPTRHLPANLYAEVFLDERWKSSLSSTKSSIVNDHEELRIEIEALLKPLLDKLESEGRQIEIRALELKINRSFNQAWQAAIEAGGEVGEGSSLVLTNGNDGSGAGEGGGSNDKRKEARGTGVNAEKKAKPQSPGVEVKLEREMGNFVAKVDVTELSIRVSLNEDLVLVKSAYKEDLRALLVLVADAILDVCAADTAICRRVIPPMAKQIQNGQSSLNAKQFALHQILSSHGGMQ